VRYLILSDIHANLEALEKCLQLAQGKYQKVLCLGDLVGYGPDPNAVIEMMQRTATVIIRGNHDKACCGIMNVEDFNPWARQAIFWTCDTLTPNHLSFLRNLAPGPLTMPGFEIVHGSAEDEDQYIFEPAEAIPALRNQSMQLVFFGHTHHQGGFSLNRAGVFQKISGGSRRNGRVLTLDLEDGTRYLINPGSVGQPRDGNWRAAFAIFDEAERRVDFYRTEYDIATTQKKMTQAHLPEPLIQRLEFGR
jgi:predicted phosphodiesterase